MGYLMHTSFFHKSALELRNLVTHRRDSLMLHINTFIDFAGSYLFQVQLNVSDTSA